MNALPALLFFSSTQESTYNTADTRSISVNSLLLSLCVKKMLFYAYNIRVEIIFMYLTGVLVGKYLHKLIWVSLKNFHKTSSGPWESSGWLKLVRENHLQFPPSFDSKHPLRTSPTLIVAFPMAAGLRVAEGIWPKLNCEITPKPPTSSNSGLILNKLIYCF